MNLRRNLFRNPPVSCSLAVPWLVRQKWRVLIWVFARNIKFDVLMCRSPLYCWSLFRSSEQWVRFGWYRDTRLWYKRSIRLTGRDGLGQLCKPLGIEMFWWCSTPYCFTSSLIVLTSSLHAHMNSWSGGQAPAKRAEDLFWFVGSNPAAVSSPFLSKGRDGS